MNSLPADGLPLFLTLLGVVAFLYASVGHGGASGYLALMALWAFPVSVMKPTALILNLFVAGASFLMFFRQGHFNRRLFLSFALASVPMAFLGGMVEVDAALYRRVLGVLLVFAILRILGIFGKESEKTREVSLLHGIVVGAGIGFFSGLIGIGGGIILGPVILLMRWGTIREAAGVSAAFIWVNSAAGLAGQLTQGISFEPLMALYVAVALLGGVLGGHFGSTRFNVPLLRGTLALVLGIASIKLILT